MAVDVTPPTVMGSANHDGTGGKPTLPLVRDEDDLVATASP